MRSTDLRDQTTSEIKGTPRTPRLTRVQRVSHSPIPPLELGRGCRATYPLPPTTYSLLPPPSSLLPTLPTLYFLHFTLYTLHPTPYTLDSPIPSLSAAAGMDPTTVATTGSAEASFLSAATCDESGRCDPCVYLFVVNFFLLVFLS